MAKKKVPVKYRQKAIMEQALNKERKAPTAPPRRKINWKLWFKSLPKKIVKFFREVVHELKRVTWPTRKTLLTYTVIVIVTLIFFAIILGVFDFLFIQLINLMAKIKV
jgi:preprotein translocase subunit SecE